MSTLGIMLTDSQERAIRHLIRFLDEDAVCYQLFERLAFLHLGHAGKRLKPRPMTHLPLAIGLAGLDILLPSFPVRMQMLGHTGSRSPPFLPSYTLL